MTQLEYADKNIITPLMKRVSTQEGISSALMLKRIKSGKIVLPLNNKHKLKKPCAIGLGLSTKINANIGTSTDKSEIKDELEKLRVACEYGTDTVMDLSVGGDIKGLRRQILRRSPVPVGTVPVYELVVTAQKKKGEFFKIYHRRYIGCFAGTGRRRCGFFYYSCGSNHKKCQRVKEIRKNIGYCV
ncbi:MAG: phosphomethylpyrimidine synthase ThiC [Candidatus Omnitrophota bacterium]